MSKKTTKKKTTKKASTAKKKSTKKTTAPKPEPVPEPVPEDAPPTGNPSVPNDHWLTGTAFLPPSVVGMTFVKRLDEGDWLGVERFTVLGDLGPFVVHDGEQEPYIRGPSVLIATPTEVFPIARHGFLDLIRRAYVIDPEDA